MACVQSRVETTQVKIMLSIVAAGCAAVNGKIVAAGCAAVNGKMVAASAGGRQWKSAYMAKRLFPAGAYIIQRVRIRWASSLIREEPCTF